MKKEIWKDIPGYKGSYQGSCFGRIKSLDRISSNGRNKIKGKLLTLIKNPRGYYVVNLYKDGKRKMFKVHRLIALTFLENPNGFPQAQHRNDVKYNNSPENLKWGLPKENNADAVRNGKFDNMPKGSNHHRAKLTEQQIIEIKYIWENSNVTQATIAERFGVPQPQISLIINNKAWKHTFQNNK